MLDLISDYKIKIFDTKFRVRCFVSGLNTCSNSVVTCNLINNQVALCCQPDATRPMSNVGRPIAVVEQSVDRKCRHFLN